MFTQIRDLVPGYRYGVDRHWLDFLLGHLDPVLSLSRTMARVVAIHDETADTKTFVLKPNFRWRGFVPGQYVPVRVTIGGAIHERCYSLTGDPRDETVAITVKRQPGGKVSNHLHDELSPGDVIELGAAAGEFVLGERRVNRLFIAGGSGITPVYSLIRAALAADAAADLVLVYYARTAADFVFGEELAELAAAHRSLTLRLIAEDTAGRFAPEQLPSDFRTRETFLCGPAGLMQAVGDYWAGERLELKREAFGPPPALDAAHTLVPVRFRRAQKTVENNRSNLLETAEAAGLRPASGCRIGICKTCTCTKLSGVVRDRVTGAIDDQPNSRIRICVSEPIGPVTLDL